MSSFVTDSLISAHQKLSEAAAMWLSAIKSITNQSTSDSFKWLLTGTQANPK